MREDIQERTDTTQEIVADVKAIATRYGITPQIEEKKREEITPQALILQGLQDF